ncbi:sirohydrochlorin cobaltochelatase [Eubacteriales bacterium OttesenSCG-928-A19]|nr:sirohydrochlorin cobaltochelatase [Eubacteriales bacterium OttesenSCG-928-A19]
MKKILSMLLVLCLMGGMSLALAEDAVKPVILVVSFGTSYNDTREATIEAIENDIAAAYPEYEVRRAFTAQTVIDILAERDGLEIDNVTGAMERLIADGVKKVVIQPTLVMAGYEYDDVVAEVAPYADQFEYFAIGKPLLTSMEDYEAVTQALLASNEYAGSEDTAIVFMGHGTHHPSNAVYSMMVNYMRSRGYENVFMGTVESFPLIDDVIAELGASEYKKVVLYPFMIVAGDHANNDMAGEEEDAWAVLLAEEGYEVESELVGLGEYEGIRAVFLEHLRAAIEGGN